MKYKIILFIVCFVLATSYYLLATTFAFADDFHTDYQVEYFLTQNENKLNSKVKLTITIKNLRSDLYVKEFSIAFPNSFVTHGVRAYDDHIELIPQISSTNLSTKITMAFSNPNVGRNSVNNLYLEFNQDNLFTVSGNVWEIIIPTVDDKQESIYKIVVHLPENSNKKLSIAKPKPSQIIGNTIIWDNPSNRTIYATFGDTQYYKTELTYHLKNTELLPVYTDIAFPPDTLYQKIFVQSIQPQPAKVMIDSDGNYIGRYYLKPRESMPVVFTGVIGVYTQMRDQIAPLLKKNFASQNSYLLSESKYWKISDITKINTIASTPKDIYNFVTNTLQYNYDKINSDNKRLGADAVLKHTNQAVCMEFTDLFVAIAREKGLYAREIEGYGFSQDAKLRPLSLASDVLHAWPEFYDSQSGNWISVDPTWENTSGIDYFSDFDLNHIVFAIHGKDPDYPLPAGTYKTEDSHDVVINATSAVPQEQADLQITDNVFNNKINDTQTYQAKITITNRGNTYLWEKPVAISSHNLQLSSSELEISPLAPYQSKTLTFAYKASVKNKYSDADLTINFPTNKVTRANFKIVPFYYEISIKISLALFIFLVLLSLFFFRRRMKRNIVK